MTFISPAIRYGVVNSIETTRIDGGYDRIIIDPEYFRKLQAGLWPRRVDSDARCLFDANAVYMTTFEKILDLIGRYRLRAWSSDAERACGKRFMMEKIVPILARRGSEVVFPDFYPRINFSNEWYFDESHLNTEGASMYSEILAGKHARVLSNKGW